MEYVYIFTNDNGPSIRYGPRYCQQWGYPMYDVRPTWYPGWRNILVRGGYYMFFKCLFHFILTCLTGGLWLIWLIIKYLIRRL